MRLYMYIHAAHNTLPHNDLIISQGRVQILQDIHHERHEVPDTLRTVHLNHALKLIINTLG